MINFNVVHFCERRSEEVISFFWHLVYMLSYAQNQMQLQNLQNFKKSCIRACAESESNHYKK